MPLMVIKPRTVSPGGACRKSSQGDFVPIRRPQINSNIYMYARNRIKSYDMYKGAPMVRGGMSRNQLAPKQPASSVSSLQ